MDSFNPYGRTWLWHPTGAKVEVPLPSEPKAMFDMVNKYLAAGFTVEPPKTAMKVETLDVAFVVRFQKMNKHNQLQDNLYFYKEYGEKGSDMTVYLNNADDIAIFEQFSGLTVAEMPIYEGDVAPQRTGMQFPKFAVSTSFTITREKEAPSEKYSTGRWLLIDYVTSRVAQNGSKTGQGSTTGDESGDTPPTAKAKAIAWAKGKGYDTSRYPYGNGDPHSEVIAKAWCEAIFKQQGSVEATG